MADSRPQRADSALALLHLLLHELRTPLNVAAGSVAPLARGSAGPLSPDQQALTDRVARSIERLERVTGELREWLALTADERSTPARAFRLAPLLDELGHAVRASHQVSLTISGPAAGSAVLGDAARLPAALRAVMEAVCRAATPGASIPVVVDGTTNEVQLLIGDCGRENGPDAGTFTAEWIGGLGLGLPLARVVIEGQGGHIRSAVDSGRVKGIAVTLRTSPEESSRGD